MHLVLLLALVFLGSLAHTGSGDFFMNLALGRLFLENWTFPRLDPFLFSIPDYEWHVWHEWLSYLYYYTLHSTVGFGGLIVVRALWLTLFAYLLWRFGRAREIPRTVLMASLLLIFMVAFERCRLDRACFFGDLFVAGLIMVLLNVDRAGRGGRWVWLIPPWFVLWANWHGSYPLGWFLLGSFVAFHLLAWPVAERKKWAAIFLLSVLGTLINPIGVEAWLWPLNVFHELPKFKEVNSEWLPFHAELFGAIRWRVGAFLAVGIAIAAHGLRRRRYWEFIVTAVLIYSCFSSIRFVGIAAFGIGAVILHDMRTWSWPRASLPLAGVTAALAAAAVLFLQPGYAFYWPRELLNERWFLATAPVAAARHMATLPPGNVFNEYDMGGILAWELNGRMKIAAHGHIHRGSLAIDHYWRYQRSPEDFRTIMVNGKVDYFIALQSELRATPDSGWVQELTKHWLPVYSDNVAVIFRRILDYQNLRAR